MKTVRASAVWLLAALLVCSADPSQSQGTTFPLGDCPAARLVNGVLEGLHNTSIHVGGHMGEWKTLEKVHVCFYWPSQRKEAGIVLFVPLENLQVTRLEP